MTRSINLKHYPTAIRCAALRCQLLLAAIFLLGCGDHDSSSSKDGKKEATSLKMKKPEQVLTIEAFSEFPPEIDGCSCYFSRDSIAFGKKQYIYVDNLDETAFLKINGKLIKFTQTALKKHDDENWTETYRGGEYVFTIDLKQLEQNGDETWLHEGTIRLTDKSKQMITAHFYGECGC